MSLPQLTVGEHGMGEQVAVAQPSEGLWSRRSEDQRGPQGPLEGSRQGHPGVTVGRTHAFVPGMGEVDSALGKVIGSCRTGVEPQNC